MIRDIIAIVDNATKAAPFLERVIAFGAARDAHIEIAALTPSPYVADMLLPVGGMYVSEDVLARDDSAKVAAVAALITDTHARVSVFGLHDDVAWLAGDMRRKRQLADLVMVATSESWDSPWLRRRVLETSILASGTPTVILPADTGLPPVRHAVLGWKPSPEANRAVHDLVAIAEPGAKVDVVIVDQDARSDAGAEVCRHLIRHDLVPELHRVSFDGIGDAEVICGYAVRGKADLLVAGGFGHSRIREVFLGGVTRHLIDDVAAAVMLSH